MHFVRFVRTTCQILLLVLILCTTITTCFAYNPNDIQWTTEKSSKLHIDGTFTLGEYRIDVVELPSPVEGNMPIGRYEGNVEPDEPVTPFVTLNLYKDGQLIESDITLYGGTEKTNAHITSDHELKIKATDFPSPMAKEWVYELYNPWATVSMQKRGIPDLAMTITTDGNSYNSKSHSCIKATIKLENIGGAYAKNLKLKVDTGGLTLKSKTLTHTYQTLEKGEKYEEEIALNVPVPPSEKQFEITATAIGYDLKDIQYTVKRSKTITITPPPPPFPSIMVEKIVPVSMYLKDTVLLKFKVANTGNYPVTNIKLDDSIPDAFILKTNTTLEWTIDELKVGDEWSRTYRLKPTAPSSSGCTFPPAHVNFTFGGKPYDVQSNQPKVIVRGPNITLLKTVNKIVVNPGETIIVTVTAKNIGDLPTRTAVMDTLPDGVELVNGELNMTKFFLKDETLTYNYTIRLDTPGEVILPNVTARFTDVVYMGTVKRFTSSEPTLITVIDPNAPVESTVDELPETESIETEVSENAENEERSDNNDVPSTTDDEHVQPGFEIIFSVISILIIYLWHRQVAD